MILVNFVFKPLSGSKSVGIFVVDAVEGDRSDGAKFLNPDFARDFPKAIGENLLVTLWMLGICML